MAVGQATAWDAFGIKLSLRGLEQPFGRFTVTLKQSTVIAHGKHYQIVRATLIDPACT
jgi:hypothetical protein